MIFIATMIGGGCDYLFQIIMGRQLGPSSYSELNAMLSLFYMVTVPSTTIGTFMIRYTSKFKAEGRDGEIAWLMKKWLLISIVLGLVLELVIFLLGPFISQFISLSSMTPLYLLMLGILIAMVSPIGYGAAQGLQRFSFSAAYGITGPAVKLVFGLTLVIGGYGIGGAVGGVLLGLLFAMVVAIFAVRDYFRHPSKPVEKREVGEIVRYFFVVVFTVICYTVMINIDIFLARQYLNPVDAGLYSTASVLSKVIWFLPSSINLVLFPKITHAYAKKANTVNIMRRSVLWAFALTGGVALAYLVMPSFILEVLYGNDFSGAATALSILGMAMAFFGLTNLFMNYGLAVNSKIFSLMIFIFTVLEIILIVSYHDSPVTIALDLFVIGLGTFISSWAYMELKFRKDANKFAWLNQIKGQ
jgi:O-antigen/teichoic acid export membrane protein